MTFRAASESGARSVSDCGQPAWQNSFGREAGIHGGGGGAGDGGGGGDGGGSGQSGLLGSWNVVVAVMPVRLPAGVAPPADDTEEPSGVDPNAPEKWTELGLQNVGR